MRSNHRKFATLVISVLLTEWRIEAFAATRTRDTFHCTLHASASVDSKSIGSLNEQMPSATCKVQVSSETSNRLGLVATENVRKGDVVLSFPYDDQFMLSASLANSVFDLPEDYEGWTGDTGLIAMLILNELARASDDENAGISEPTRPAKLQGWMKAWVQALPSLEDLKDDHPLLWSESDQEILQSSSTNKVYRQLDDLEEDAAWWVENMFKDRQKFPETVTLDGVARPCFSPQGFSWAMALARSRTFFVDNALRLIPVLDMANHDDSGREIESGYMGTFGTTKGCQLVADKAYKKGEEIFCSYGPKSAADYLLEHGFVPGECWKTNVAELSFELDPEGRFYDDKLDILEFETYDQAPMDPVQSFDVVSAVGRQGEPDPGMLQFVRLSLLGSTDAFLLESLFRKDVWGFMELPVSEVNERLVVEAIMETCQTAMDELDAKDTSDTPNAALCQKLRESEQKALKQTYDFLQRDKEALDLKEYYQERRLKDLGLDSEWSPEDDLGDGELGFGQTRAPGGADYDW